MNRKSFQKVHEIISNSTFSHGWKIEGTQPKLRADTQLETELNDGKQSNQHCEEK